MELKTRALKVSIIIPAFNADFSIDKCLKALAQQTFKPLEIIAVNDGSYDKTANILSDFKFSYLANLKILKQSHKGAAAARNLGAKKALGDIFVFIDSDCMPPKNWLKNIVEVFKNNKIGACGGGYSSGVDNSFWQRFCHEELFFRRRNLDGKVNTLVSCNMAVRKSCFNEIGGFPVFYSVCEDMYLSYLISKRFKIVWLKNNGVKHHFKKSFSDFLKHQYFFGRESAKFFLNNPRILTNNHQGKLLHLSIMISFLFLISLFSAVLFSATGHTMSGKMLLQMTVFLLIVHFLLYLNFIKYLNKEKFSKIELFYSYVTLMLRDIICTASFFEGFFFFFKGGTKLKITGTIWPTNKQ